MNQILVATGNPGKFKEIGEALSGLADFRLVSLKEFAERSGVALGEPVEDGATFSENAYKKASYFLQKSGSVGAGNLMVLAEDSGILVDALAGELGMKTRRWGAGERASDEEWLEFFMKRMEGVEDRGARFVCSACLVWRDGAGVEFVNYFDGETRGVITEGLEAPLMAGVPLSSCFRAEGFEKVYSALSVEEKNRISHRGKAMAGVREFLLELQA